jgi:hypothetical protein
MNNSSSVSSFSSAATPSSKSTNSQDKNTDSIDDLITINEKIQQILKIICDIYEISFSEYMQQALVEAMRFDIEEGNFSDALLEKIGGEDNKQNNSSPSSSASLAPDLMKNDLDLLKKLQTQI